MYVYKLCVHQMHVWIKPNALTHDMTGKYLMYENQVIFAIIFPFQNLPTIKQNIFYNFY